MDLKEAIKLQELKDLMVKDLKNGNREIVLDIGLQALKISEDWQIYRDMGRSSLELQKYKDAINFFKQRLKLVAKIKDAGVLQQLWAYLNLINAQYHDKDYKAAMKTCRKLKIFNLDSENVQDVQLEMLRARFRSLMEDEMALSANKIPMVLESYLTFRFSVLICLIKTEIFIALDCSDLACNWLHAIEKILCDKQIWITADKNDALIFLCEIDISKGLEIKDTCSRSKSKIAKSCFKSEELENLKEFLVTPEISAGFLINRRLMLGIASLEYMGKNFASAGEISACQKFFKTIIRVMLPSPTCLESKVIPFINHIIENSLNEDSKKNILRCKNSIIINNHFHLAVKNLEKWQKFCEETGINRRKAISLTAYFR